MATEPDLRTAAETAVQTHPITDADVAAGRFRVTLHVCPGAMPARGRRLALAAAQKTLASLLVSAMSKL